MIELFRQKELLPLVFIAPILQVVLLGYVISTDIKNIPVDVANLSETMTANRIVTRICSTPLFKVQDVSREPADWKATLKRGDVKAVIVLRDGFEKGKKRLVTYPEIQILMDGVDSNTSSIAAGYFNGIIQKFILDDMEKRGMELPIQNKSLIRFNPELRSINYMGPGIVALLLVMLSLFLTSVSIVREKEQQTMDTLLSSNLRPLEIFLGKAGPMAVLGIAQMCLGILVVGFWFKIPIRGNILYLFVAAVIFLAAILSYALLISTISSTQQQALFFAWFSSILFILLSGLFTPVENIPPVFRVLADINPVRYLIEIIREIYLKGNGIEYFLNQLFILLLIAVVVTFISVANFKRFISK